MLAAELNKLRVAHAATLTASCSIWRKTVTPTESGGISESWAEESGDVPCRVMPELTKRIVDVIAEREASVSYYRLTVPYETDLRADDRVEYAGETYEVIILWDDHNFATAQRAIIAKVI